MTESNVLAQAFHKTRTAVTSTLFPHFQSKNRLKKSKTPSVSNYPHQLIELQGSGITMTVGPCSFDDIKFYECIWSKETFGTTTDQTSSSSTTTTATTASGSTSIAPVPGRTLPQNLASPSPSLVSLLQTRARSDPLLSQILTLAAQNKASPEQVTALGKYVNALQTQQERQAEQNKKNEEMKRKQLEEEERKKKREEFPVPPGPKPREGSSWLVFEFGSNPNERFFLPDHFYASEISHDEEKDVRDVMIRLLIVPQKSLGRTKEKAFMLMCPVNMKLSGVGSNVWNAFQRGMKGVDAAKRQLVFDEQVSRDWF
jgi:hypothetical protein